MVEIGDWRGMGNFTAKVRRVQRGRGAGKPENRDRKVPPTGTETGTGESRLQTAPAGGNLTAKDGNRNRKVELEKLSSLESQVEASSLGNLVGGCLPVFFCEEVSY